MTAVVLTFHTLIVLGLIGVVLLQRSEGGALGMGAGSGGGFMTGRGAANALTRTTSILAALFFATSLGLAIFADTGEDEQQVIEELTGEAAPDLNGPLAPTADDLLQTLGGGADTATSDPSDEGNAPASEAEILDALGADVDAAVEDAVETPEAVPADAAEEETSDAETGDNG